MLSFQPLSSGTSFLRSLPYISLRKHRGEVHNAILIPKLKRRFQYSSAVPRSIAGCSYKEYRGSAHRTEGLKNSDSNKIKYQTLPLPCPAALRGVVYKIEAEAKGEYISPSSSVFCAAKYRRGGRRTEGLEKNKKRVDV